MRLQSWHLVLLMYPILIAVGVLGLYWVIRLAVRAGINDARAGRGSDQAGPSAPSPDQR